MDGSKSLPDVLEAVVLGPEDRLVVVLPAHTTRDAFAMAQAQLRATAFADRVLMVCGAEQLAVLRSPKAEGSTVGQCGDEHDVTVFGLAGGIDEYEVHRCHLAYGHTGMHSDGTATWMGRRRCLTR